MSFTLRISKIKKPLFFILGIAVAAFVIAQEVIDYHCTRIVTATESADDGGDADHDQQQSVYEYTFEFTLPSAPIQLDAFIPVFIGEVIRESDERETKYQQVALYDSPLYKNLFRQIISPNAP